MLSGAGLQFNPRHLTQIKLISWSHLTEFKTVGFSAWERWGMELAWMTNHFSHLGGLFRLELILRENWEIQMVLFMLSLSSELHKTKQTCPRILLVYRCILRQMLQMLQFSLSEEFAHFYTPLITEMLCLTY